MLSAPVSRNLYKLTQSVRKNGTPPLGDGWLAGRRRRRRPDSKPSPSRDGPESNLKNVACSITVCYLAVTPRGGLPENPAANTMLVWCRASGHMCQPDICPLVYHSPMTGSRMENRLQAGKWWRHAIITLVSLYAFQGLYEDFVKVGDDFFIRRIRPSMAICSWVSWEKSWASYRLQVWVWNNICLRGRTKCSTATINSC